VKRRARTLRRKEHQRGGGKEIQGSQTMRRLIQSHHSRNQLPGGDDGRGVVEKAEQHLSQDRWK